MFWSSIITNIFLFSLSLQCFNDAIDQATLQSLPDLSELESVVFNYSAYVVKPTQMMT